MPKIRSFLRTQGKGLSLLFMMFLGGLFPQAHAVSFLIQYLLMIMLFFAFLDIEFKPRMFQKSVLWVLLANVTLAFISYALLRSFGVTFALAGFMTAIAPTAIAAPVVISFIEREVEYVVAAVLLTNVASAVILPLALPSLLGAELHISVWEVLQPVLIVMFLPLILARLAIYLPSNARSLLRKGKSFSFLVWLGNLFIISADASNFLRNGDGNSTITLIAIALIALTICILNFSVGALLGGRGHWQESSQSLG